MKILNSTLGITVVCLYTIAIGKCGDRSIIPDFEYRNVLVTIHTSKQTDSFSKWLEKFYDEYETPLYEVYYQSENIKIDKTQRNRDQFVDLSLGSRQGLNNIGIQNPADYERTDTFKIISGQYKKRQLDFKMSNKEKYDKKYNKNHMNKNTNKIVRTNSSFNKCN